MRGILRRRQKQLQEEGGGYIVGTDSLLSQIRNLEAQPPWRGGTLEESDCETESFSGEYPEPQILLEEEEEEEQIEEDPEVGPGPEFVGRARLRVDPVRGRYGESTRAIGQSATAADSSHGRTQHAESRDGRQSASSSSADGRESTA